MHDNSCKYELVVSVSNHLRHRYGTFDIHGRKNRFPMHAVTSTNLNHAKNCKFAPFNFGTNVAIILETEPEKLLNMEYKERRRKIITKIIQDYSEYLFVFSINNIKSKNKKQKNKTDKTPFEFTKENNTLLINFQKECGFESITVFFKHGQYDETDYDYYRSLVSNDVGFIAAVDENMKSNKFIRLYAESIKQKDDIIAFFGRNPNKRIKKNARNFDFIKMNLDNKILRLSLCTEKEINGVVGSLVHHLYGIDVIALRTRLGNPNIIQSQIKALYDFNYKPLLSSSRLRCYITGEPLYESTQYFAKKFKKSTVPATTHAIVRLNEQFQNLHMVYSISELYIIAKMDQISTDL